MQSTTSNHKIKTVRTMGFDVFSSSLESISLNTKAPKILNTISPNSYGISTKDDAFREALKKSDYLVLDGVYFALSSIILHGKNIKRNQGPDVFYHFMDRSNKNHYKVFFLGASESTLEKIKIKAKVQYPNIKIDSYSPPFKDEFTEEENDVMIKAINEFEPDVLFVGMTCPKQEKWSSLNQYFLNVKLICCIGGVFDWYAGNYKEISEIWWKLRLGWLIRAIQRPDLLKRNIPNYYIFLKDLILIFLKLKTTI